MNQNMIYDVSYMDALKRGFKQYVTFSGRTSRSEFWRFMVCREIILDGLACFRSYRRYGARQYIGC